MSVASEITRLLNAKADLKTAIEGKGVTVSADAKLDAYPALVESIQTGGGGDEDVWYAIDGVRGIKYILYNDGQSNFDSSYSATHYGDHITFYPEYTTNKFSIYFEYRGEKYYTTDINVGSSNHLPLTKTGTPVENPTIMGGFDRFRLYLDSGIWYTDFSD